MSAGMESVWWNWHAHPDALIGLAVLEGIYLLGVGPLRERYRLADKVEPRQVATFTAGVLAIFVALVSPIHVLSDKYLFSVHMVQHVLLMLVAPPLLLLGTPDWLVRPLLRPNWSFRLARFLTHPVIAFAAVNIIFSMWHIPVLYNLSVEHHLIHVGQHLLFIGTSLMMWWPILSLMPELPRISYPLQMVYLFLLSVAQLILFAPITFSRQPIYEWYVNAPRVLNISPLVDQQLGGIIMKMAGGVLFMTLLIVFFFRWFGREEQRTKAEEAESERLGNDSTKGPVQESDLT